MAIEVKVPQLPESVADASIAAWHKQPGDTVVRGENLVDLETDKVVLEVPAPADGVLQTILKSVGDRVSADEVLAMLTTQKAEASAAAPAKKQPEASKPSAFVSAAPSTASVELSPAVRRLVQEQGIDAAKISGSGKHGRVLREDVEQQPPQVALTGSRVERRVPMTRLRARIAERLVAAQHHAAMLTTFNEVNLQAVNDLRARYKDSFEKAHGVRLGFMSFFTKAVIEALKRFPCVNASIDGEEVVYHGYFDIGMAVSTDRGLVVPVMRNAEQLGMADIEKQIGEFAKKARDNKLTMEDITGGTFTITNGGVFGSLLSTPILNPPQSAILGMHKIEQRPVVENNQIVIRPMMYLALTYDHRIIDGRESVQFLVTVKEMLEDPTRLLLEV